MTLTEIGRPQISDGCPYKVLNSQWVPTRPAAMRKTKMNVTMLHLFVLCVDTKSFLPDADLGESHIDASEVQTA